jgi:hypothetical protein
MRNIKWSSITRSRFVSAATQTSGNQCKWCTLDRPLKPEEWFPDTYAFVVHGVLGYAVHFLFVVYIAIMSVRQLGEECEESSSPNWWP